MTPKKIFLGLLFFYGHLSGGIPHASVWRSYLKKLIPSASVVVDIGGGDGQLANALASSTKWFFILDKEETSREGADNLQYMGVLARALKSRRYPNIIPIQGDAIAFPFADESLDVIVSCELLEHLDYDAKKFFFSECRRTLKTGGRIIISTPNAEFIDHTDFWLPRVSKKWIPKRWIPKLPFLLRGPWLTQTIEEWETSVGHYDRGCRLSHIQSVSKDAGFDELNHRFLHTPLTLFWLQLMLTFPLFYLLCIPIIRVFYVMESWKRDGEGAGLLIAFRKAEVAPGIKVA
jgi:ubiquinone/menaquinone biosynthesis C-methylase UbiE